MSTWTVSAARAALPQIIDEVTQGGEVTLTRHGEPVAVIVRPDSIRASRLAGLRQEARKLGELISAVDRHDVPTPGLSVEYADEMVAEIRAGRDSR